MHSIQAMLDLAQAIQAMLDLAQAIQAMLDLARAMLDLAQAIQAMLDLAQAIQAMQHDIQIKLNKRNRTSTALFSYFYLQSCYLFYPLPKPKFVTASCPYKSLYI